MQHWFCLSCSVVSNSLQPHGLQPSGSSEHGSSRQEFQSGLPLPPPGGLPDARTPGLGLTWIWVMGAWHALCKHLWRWLNGLKHWASHRLSEDCHLLPWVTFTHCQGRLSSSPPWTQGREASGASILGNKHQFCSQAYLRAQISSTVR